MFSPAVLELDAQLSAHPCDFPCPRYVHVSVEHEINHSIWPLATSERSVVGQHGRADRLTTRGATCLRPWVEKARRDGEYQLASFSELSQRTLRFSKKSCSRAFSPAADT